MPCRPKTAASAAASADRNAFWAERDYLAHADKIKAPLLLIHGAADNNSGTYPMQSKRMYAALKGNGATVRWVELPLEEHGYRARESIGHALWEMIQWADTYVKDAEPREAAK